MKNDKSPSTLEPAQRQSYKAKQCSANQFSSDGVPVEQINTIIKKDARREHINVEDIVQIIIGSMAAAIVFAPTSELRAISLNLPLYKLAIIFLLTSTSVGLLAYWAGGRKLRLNEIHTIASVIPVRILLIYAISFISCLIALWIYDIITIQSNIFDVIRIVIVLLLPATWGGTLIDLIYSKHR
jgi:uncharacterized membrane protein